MKLRAVAVLFLVSFPSMAACGAAPRAEGTTAEADSTAPPPPEGALEAAEPHGHGHADHRFCGWLHEFPADPKMTDLGYDTFARHARTFDAVHPKWWRMDSTTTFANHPADRATPFGGFHDRRVLAHTTYSGKRTKLVPLVAASVKPDYLYAHTMINDPAVRREHVKNLVALAVSNRYDGLDIDYEHFSRGIGPGQTRDTEREAFSTFIRELSAAMHAAGKIVSLAVPVEAGEPHPIFDYDALSAAADQVHVMTYDFHYEAGEHPGPVSPLGWVHEAVAYIGNVAGGQRNGKFILGLPNYGLYGPEQPPDNFQTIACEPLIRCQAMLSGSYSTTTDHMSHCTMASKPFEPGRAPNLYLANGDHLFFDDLESLEEKVREAKQGKLGGITYWSIGGEPDRPGCRSFFEMVRSYFPQRR
ncbi:glycosyl hydrolase family 18 protein [Pendulispora albinea]|uniref:Glycosyl hydrolase family 18 protein n=1 Tax=Pendulispora albinea TaxID=2741071 RepID=A0ABZ2LZX9_9BACT